MENENNESVNDSEQELIQAIGVLSEMCSQQEDSASAMLYRLMFRQEKNINILF